MVTRSGVVFLLLCLLVLLAGIRTVEAAAGEVVVKVIPDRTTVRVNEEFKVRFVAESSDKELQAPDWSALRKNFQVRQGGRKLRSRDVNGVRRTVTEWELYLKPKRTGRLQIPPLQFGATRSKAVSITVQARPQAKKKPKKPKKPNDFFVEVTATNTAPYVQAQVLFTLQVFMAHSLRGSVSPPKSDSKAIVKSLGDARKYRQRRGSRNYEVYERKYLIYPQASGKMTIKPVTLTGSYIRGGKSFSVNRKSPSLVLNVRQVPSSFPGKFWLPAERFILEEKWSSDLSSWQAGDPVKRKLKLQATGLLARQLPEVSLPDVEGFRLYAEPANSKNSSVAKGIIGVVERSAVLIPAQAGVYRLPGLKIPWWNTKTDRLEFAELPEKTVTVSEVAFSSLVMDEPEAQTVDEVESPVAGFAAMATGERLWFWFSMVFLFGWLATAIMMWRGGALYQRFRFMRKRSRSIGEARKALQKACQEDNAVQAKDALLHWSELIWPDDSPASISEIGRRCGGTAEECIRELNRSLYGASDSEWQGSALWESLARQSAAIDEDSKEGICSLEPLHKINGVRLD